MIAELPKDCEVLVVPAPTYALLGAARSAAGWSDIDVQLAEWLADPSAAVDYGAIPPSRMSIRFARAWLSDLRHHLPVPEAVVPDGSGGVTFEWRSGPVSRWIEVSPSGEAQEV